MFNMSGLYMTKISAGASTLSEKKQTWKCKTPTTLSEKNNMVKNLQF